MPSMPYPTAPNDAHSFSWFQVQNHGMCLICPQAHAMVPKGTWWCPQHLVTVLVTSCDCSCGRGDVSGDLWLSSGRFGWSSGSHRPTGSQGAKDSPQLTVSNRAPCWTTSSQKERPCPLFSEISGVLKCPLRSRPHAN